MKVKLGEICDIQSGGTPSRSNAEYWTQGTIPWVKIGDFDGKYLKNTEEYITELGLKNSSAKLFSKGTILYSIFATLGETCILEIDAATNQAIAGLQITSEEVDSNYLYYYLISKKEEVCSQGRGVAQNNINLSILRSMELEIPTFSEQKEICSVLDKVSGLIALRKKQLQKLDELVKARFVEMFELHSWPQHKAGIFMDDMRNGVSPSNTGTYKAHVLTLSAITQGTFDRNAWKEGDFDCIPSEDKRVSVCDFYMCRGNGNRNLVGAGVYSKENLYDLVFPDTVIAARVDTNMVRLPFLCEAWKRPAIRSQIEAGARTTNGTFKINQKVIANIDISIPPIELQDSFVAFVEQTDKSKLAIQKGLDRLELMKKALMQKYFG